MPSTTRSTFFTYPTKFGPVTIAADGTAVTAVSFGEQNLPGDRQPTALTTEAANQIMAYLARPALGVHRSHAPRGQRLPTGGRKAAAEPPYGHTTTAAPSPKRWGTPAPSAPSAPPCAPAPLPCSYQRTASSPPPASPPTTSTPPS